MEDQQPTKKHVLNAISFENDTTIKIELNRPPANMSKRMLARYVFNQLKNLN
jgi:hypothetical protein